MFANRWNFALCLILTLTIVLGNVTPVSAGWNPFKSFGDAVKKGIDKLKEPVYKATNFLIDGARVMFDPIGTTLDKIEEIKNPQLRARTPWDKIKGIFNSTLVASSDIPGTIMHKINNCVAPKGQGIPLRQATFEDVISAVTLPARLSAGMAAGAGASGTKEGLKGIFKNWLTGGEDVSISSLFKNIVSDDENKQGLLGRVWKETRDLLARGGTANDWKETMLEKGRDLLDRTIRTNLLREPKDGELEYYKRMLEKPGADLYALLRRLLKGKEREKLQNIMGIEDYTSAQEQALLEYQLQRFRAWLKEKNLMHNPISYWKDAAGNPLPGSVVMTGDGPQLKEPFKPMAIKGYSMMGLELKQKENKKDESSRNSLDDLLGK